LCFTIGKKIYCLTDLKDPYKACIKVTPDDFTGMTQNGHAIQAAYMAKGQWLLIPDTSKIKQKELQRLLKDSYHLVRSKLTKKMQQELS
jgi:predicted DNA-binding protein (MmcQ/YjbR family)